MKLQDFDFRIWDNKTNKFIELNISDNIRALPRKNDDLVLELWSGFYDSKGTKIYEGDIVICNTLKFVVEYKRVKFILKQIAENGLSVSLHYSETLEVLGNIHENADLLKEQQ